jgi:hypothetical protein
MGRFHSLPQDSFRRRVRLNESSWAGFLAFGSSPHPQPSPSAQGRTVAGDIAWEDLARRSQWRDHGRFARPFLFPVVQTEHRRNQSFQRTNNANETSTIDGALSMLQTCRGPRQSHGCRVPLGLCMYHPRINPSPVPTLRDTLSPRERDRNQIHSPLPGERVPDGGGQARGLFQPHRTLREP